MLIESDFDLIIASAYHMRIPEISDDPAEAPAIWWRGFERWIAPVLDSGKHVTVIRDTPFTDQDRKNTVPRCLASTSDYTSCGGTQQEWLPFDPMADAVDAVDRDSLTLIDLTDRFCRDDFCPAVAGGVVIYRDTTTSPRRTR